MHGKEPQSSIAIASPPPTLVHPPCRPHPERRAGHGRALHPKHQPAAVGAVRVWAANLRLGSGMEGRQGGLAGAAAGSGSGKRRRAVASRSGGLLRPAAAGHGLEPHLDTHYHVRLPQPQAGRAGRLRNDAQLHRQLPKVLPLPPIVAAVEGDGRSDPLDLPSAYERAGHTAAARWPGKQCSDGFCSPIAGGCSSHAWFARCLAVGLSCRAPSGHLGEPCGFSPHSIGPMLRFAYAAQATGGMGRRAAARLASLQQLRPLQATAANQQASVAV